MRSMRNARPFDVTYHRLAYPNAESLRCLTVSEASLPLKAVGCEAAAVPLELTVEVVMLEAVACASLSLGNVVYPILPSVLKKGTAPIPVVGTETL